jgi:hypothetical protein
MFALRDFGAASREAVLALAEGFKDGSALFRYVSILTSHDEDFYRTLFSLVDLVRDADDQSRSSLHFRSTLLAPFNPISPPCPQGSKGR